MNFCWACIIFASLFFISFAVEYNIEAAKHVASNTKIPILTNQNTFKVLDFLQEYVAHRSEEGGWKKLMAPLSLTSLYYVCSVKLSDTGDKSSRVKNDQVTVEYVLYDGDFLGSNNVTFKSVAGFIYKPTNTGVAAETLQNAVMKGVEKFIGVAMNLPVKKTPTAHFLPHPKLPRNVEVAHTVVRGTNCGHDVGEFVLIAGYIDKD